MLSTGGFAPAATRRFSQAERRVGLFLFCSSQICEDRAGNVSALSCKHSVKVSDLSSESRNMKLLLKRKSYVPSTMCELPFLDKVLVFGAVGANAKFSNACRVQLKSP